MKKRRENIATALLALFFCLSTLPFVMPEAPPSATDTNLYYVQFEESNEGDLAGMLRSSGESHEENPRPNDSEEVSCICDFHSEVSRKTLVKSLRLEEGRKATEEIHLLHSRFTI